MQRLCDDLAEQLAFYGVSKITSVYIGGGTPSVVESSKYQRIFEILYPFLKGNAEVNIEANPNSLTLEWIKNLKSFGVNRLSLGVQSFFAEKLRFLERIHREDSIYGAMENALKVGLENISIDLIYGTPFCAKEILEQEVQMASKLPINHISAYQLSIDEGSRFFVQQKREFSGEFEGYPSMGHFMKECLGQQGFVQYEVSNYARGYYSKHNLGYWEQKEYLGFGLSAHSYYQKQRYSNIENLEQYIENVQKGLLEKNKILQEEQNQEEEQREYMLLGLRKLQGVSIQAFQTKFGNHPLKLYANSLEKLQKENLIEIKKDTIQLTNRGLDLANLVWEEFV